MWPVWTFLNCLSDVCWFSWWNQLVCFTLSLPSFTGRGSGDRRGLEPNQRQIPDSGVREKNTEEPGLFCWSHHVGEAGQLAGTLADDEDHRPGELGDVSSSGEDLLSPLDDLSQHTSKRRIRWRDRTPSQNWWRWRETSAPCWEGLRIQTLTPPPRRWRTGDGAAWRGASWEDKGNEEPPWVQSRQWRY